MERNNITQKSNSGEQQAAERMIFQRISEKFALDDLMDGPVLPLKGNPSVCIRPDFYSASAGVIGEIHAHIGRLKPAQSHKIAADILKMMLYETDSNTRLRKIIAVCSEEERRQLEGQSFLAQAIRQFGAEIILVDIDEEQRAALLKAQERQKMVNA